MSFPLNMTFHQGDDFLFEMTFYEEDDTTPLNMADKVMSLTVKPAVDADDTDAAAYIKLNTADFIVDSDPDGGGAVLNRVNVLFPRASTKLIPVGTHVIDFQVKDAAAHLLTYGYGDCVVEPQISRREPT